MSIEYHYDPDKKILYGSFKGRLTLEEFATTMRTMLESGDFPPDADTLWDFRELNFTVIDRPYEEQLLAIRKGFPERGGARLAYVVGNQLGLGMMRMYEILSEDMYEVMSEDLRQESRVFTSYSEGERWLLERQPR